MDRAPSVGPSKLLNSSSIHLMANLQIVFEQKQILNVP